MNMNLLIQQIHIVHFLWTMYYSSCWECSNKQSRQDASFRGTHLLVGREGQWSKCMLHKMISGKYRGKTWTQRDDEPIVNSVKNSYSWQLHNCCLSVRVKEGVWDLCEDNWNCIEIVAGELLMLCGWIKWDSVSSGDGSQPSFRTLWQLTVLRAICSGYFLRCASVFIPHPWTWLWDVVTNLTLAFPSWQEHTPQQFYTCSFHFQ